MNLSGFFTEYIGSSVETIIWSLFIGIIAASALTFYNKQILGGFVRKLVANNASSPETAQTLSDTGYSKNVFVRYALREKSTFRKVVKAAEVTSNTKPDLANMHFYVPKELEERVDLQYNGGGTTVLSFLLSVLVFFAVAILSLVLVPILTDFVSTLFESFINSYN